VAEKRSALPVPYAMEVADRARKERYYDPDFYRLEAELLWPRVWQMACRLEEIPGPGDFVEYEILDQSVIVLRAADLSVRAFQNACRHRGVKVIEGRGTLTSGFTCPFHGWCYGEDGTNTHIPQRRTFAEHNVQPGDIDLTPVRCDTWGGCAWINLDDGAPPLRQCIEPAATILDGWKVESLRTEWWYACRLPVNWKLAIEAFVESYHVVQTHPQLVIPTRYGMRTGTAFDARAFVDADIEYLRTMSEGMAGMVHANDLRIAEGLRDLELPSDPEAAMSTWYRTLNDAVVEWHRGAGADVPDLNELEAQGSNEPMGYCFPHYCVLPMYSSASS
jgi:phenylpropionate dioxygenase-like ring-hydroxylating dioxygenase large terminal subunit